MKHEWKKHEKQFYLPGSKPEVIEIPCFRFFTIQGEGNPNDDFFGEYISILYSLSYAVKMSPKRGIAPKDYHDYTVYPLEGVWNLTEHAQKRYDGTINKNDLVFNLMIRQPVFVDKNFALQIIELTKKSKPHSLLDQVRFEEITEGTCIQMLHKGSYDNENISFKEMESYGNQRSYIRKSKIHREIYLSDARKVPSEKLRTVLRFCVDKV